MSNETTLLPCPFCGGEAHISDDYSSKRGMVYSVWHDCPAGGDYHPYGQGVGVLQVTSAWFSSREEVIATWNTRATHGTLTAEQVEKAVHDCSTYASYDGCTYYASGIRLQAIADELNARAAKPCYATDYTHEHCKYSVNRGWVENTELWINGMKDLLLKTFGLAQMMHDCWLEECKAGDNVDMSACNVYAYEFDQVAQAMLDAGIDPNGSAYYQSAELGSGTCKLDYDRHCSNCGVYVHESAVLVRKDLDGGLWTVVAKPPNFCPNCGKAVKR